MRRETPKAAFLVPSLSLSLSHHSLSLLLVSLFAMAVLSSRRRQLGLTFAGFLLQLVLLQTPWFLNSGLKGTSESGFGGNPGQLGIGFASAESTLFQDTSWEQLNFTSGNPGVRYGAATLGVSSPKGLILFGGVDEEGILLGDTWQFLADQNLWLRLKEGSGSCCGKNCTTGTPCPRAYSTLDSVSTRALLFGGSCSMNPEVAYTGIPCEDVLWEFDLLNNQWKRIYAGGHHDALAPVPRAGHAAISQGRSLFVHGGHTGTRVVEGDERNVWEYNWDSNTWAKLEPAGELLKSGQTLPSVTFTLPKRFGHAAILHQYQSKKRILFHGGMRSYDDSGQLYVSNDIVEWDITTQTWRKWDLQYSPFRAFHTMHLYSPSSAFSQGTGYIVMAFGYGHDKPNVRGTFSDVKSSDTQVVRGVDVHVFDDNSVVTPEFMTYEVLQGLKPTGRHSPSGAFIGDGRMLTAGGVTCDTEAIGLPEQALCKASTGPYWILHMKGQLYDQGTLSIPSTTKERADEILVMSGEVEIAKWQSGTALPVQLSIPSGTDIVAIAFKGGVVVATEKLMIVPEEVKTLQLNYIQAESATITCLREDLVSAFPDLKVEMEVYDVRNKGWALVSQGNTSSAGQFQADLIPARNLYTGTIANYVMKYETSYRFRAFLPNGTIAVPSQLIEVYPGVPLQIPYVSIVETLPEREIITLTLPEPTQNSTNSSSPEIVTELVSSVYPLQYSYLTTALHPLRIWQEFKVLVESESAPIGLFASVESEIKYPTARKAEWHGTCTESESGAPHTCWVKFNSFGNVTQVLALGISTNVTNHQAYTVKIKAEIIEHKVVEEVEEPLEEPANDDKSIAIDVEQIGMIAGCCVGFVLLVTSAIKFIQARRKAQVIAPRGRKKMPDVESGGLEGDSMGNKGWDNIMSRHKDSDIFDDFGELASEYQRWMAQDDASKVQENKEEKLATLQKLSVKYDELQEDRKTLEGIPLAMLNLNAKDLETRKKYSGKIKPKKSANGLVVPRAPAGILPPQHSKPPEPPVDSPVGYDLTPHKRPQLRDPRFGIGNAKGNSSATTPTQIETDFLQNIKTDAEREAKSPEYVAIGGKSDAAVVAGVIPSGRALPADLIERAERDEDEEDELLSPPPPPPSASSIRPPPAPAGPSRPLPPPEPAPAHQLKDLQDIQKDVFSKKIQIKGAPKNALQKMKKPRKKKD